MRQLDHFGHDSIAIAMPGQDGSPLNQVGFGKPESHVIVDAVKWLRECCPNRKVIVVGISMGGAAAWLATQEDPHINGIVTDCAFANFTEAMNGFFDCKVPGGHIIFAPVILIARGISGIDPASIRPLDAALHWRGKPALVIQGNADTLVTPSHGLRLSQAAQCPLWMVPNANHAQAYATDPEGYVQRLISLAKQI
jgi:pimeloyl-ACP methyl ester carboxylesterase